MPCDLYLAPRVKNIGIKVIRLQFFVELFMVFICYSTCLGGYDAFYRLL
jgi:hypothetical protein